MQFFKLKQDEGFANAWWDDDAIESHSVHCPIHKGHQRSSDRLGTLTIILTTSKIGDFVWTWYSECIITDRVARLFKEAGLTGYHLEPVKVSRIRRGDKDIGHLPKLWELRLTGWAGMAPPESGVKLLYECEGCGLLEYSAYDNPSRLIDPSQWGGSDFFMVWPLPRFIFVTDRVQALIKERKLRGCRLVPVEKLPHGPKHNPLGTLGPGRLRTCMPDDRARELGEPLGIY